MKHLNSKGSEIYLPVCMWNVYVKLMQILDVSEVCEFQMRTLTI